MQTEENNNNNNNTTDHENISRTRTLASTNKPSYRILLVDDNNDILITIKGSLEDNGFIVDAFSNPLEHYPLLSQNHIIYF